MIEFIDTLAAFSRHGTSARAAVALRITQAAVSKRLAALERDLGFAILKRQGRLAVLTEAATNFLKEVEPHIAAIREATSQAQKKDETPLRVALSESLALSWGGEWISGFQTRHPHVHIDLHVHRAPLAIQQVAAGKYDLAVTPGWAGTPKGLTTHLIGHEKMVLLTASALKPALSTLEVLTIEESSATWTGLNRQIDRACKGLGIKLKFTGRIESFAAVVQLAKVGLCHGLAPIGIASSIGFPQERIVDIFCGKVSREITLTCTQSVSRSQSVRLFRDYLKAEMSARTF